MSCSSKYEKLVEYLKTHYTYQLKLNRFAIGNNEELDSKIKREVYKNIMEFVENLETQEELQEKQKNNLIPVDFGTPAGADTISLNFTTDPITFGEQKTYPVTLGGSDTDTLNFGSPIPGGMGEDHISFNSTSRKVTEAKNETEWKDFFKPSKDQPPYYEDEFGLVAGDINLSTEKDDK
tara:strand:- start:3 stop:539 length:537 start_codon:yes stop_codon:yes gene_type:complete